MIQKDLYIVRGVQGSGKTTFVESLKRPDDVSVAADDFMVNEKGAYAFDWRRFPEVHAKCRATVESAMKRGVERIFLHNTSVKAGDVAIYLDMAKKYGYRAFSIVVENRHGSRDKHGTPSSTKEKMKGEFDISL